MNKKTVLSCLLIIAFLGAALVFANSAKPETKKQNLSEQPCSDSTQCSVETTDQSASADKVEVFLFHGMQRCATCIAIGKLAGETVNEYFQSELRDGKIEFREINIDLPENQALSEKFQASGSALFINAIKKGEDHIEQDAKVWRLTQDETQFKSYLKNKLDNLLGKSI